MITIVYFLEMAAGFAAIIGIMYTHGYKVILEFICEAIAVLCMAKAYIIAPTIGGSLTAFICMAAVICCAMYSMVMQGTKLWRRYKKLNRARAKSISSYRK